MQRGPRKHSSSEHWHVLLDNKPVLTPANVADMEIGLMSSKSCRCSCSVAAMRQKVGGLVEDVLREELAGRMVSAQSGSSGDRARIARLPGGIAIGAEAMKSVASKKRAAGTCCPLPGHHTRQRLSALLNAAKHTASSLLWWSVPSSHDGDEERNIVRAVIAVSDKRSADGAA